MYVYCCDICNRKLDKVVPDYLEVSLGWPPSTEICKTCAQPIMEALKDQELLPEKLLKELEPVNG